MSKNLVIVESPAKSKTIKKYLGKDFEVMASYGHVRDLIPKEGAVDPDKDFAMTYQVIERNEKHVQAIGKALKKAEALYLATDPDREGEAISWHLLEVLRDKGLLKDKPVYRVVFHEITKTAVEQAIAAPRDVAPQLVDAQQARRALDYLVGFNLSPLLWKKIRRGLSAGRVQSPALRLIVEREDEIEAFEAREYWSIEAEVAREDAIFRAKLARLDGEKFEQFTVTSEAAASTARQRLDEAAAGELLVSKVERKQRRRNPTAPFITSTLQQEASRKLGFTARRTMRVAQQLYEGIELGGETVGLITYMRTDSVNLANDAIAEIRQLVADKYGEDNLPDKPRTYKTRAKNAQEAHEGIRPTSVMREPAAIRGHLSEEQYRLYDLVWKRTVACQMIHATFDTVAINLEAGEAHTFRATGSTMVSPGFMAVYQEGRDDSKGDEDEDHELPRMEEGERLALREIIPEQHFTEPPPRYSEATLVKALEEYGIGRPSTYASIISTLQDREYVEMDRKRFVPTDVGKVVNRFLTRYFPQYVDYQFTARLEDQLDAVSRGERDWQPLLREFWQPFKERVDDTQENVSRSEVTQEKMDEDCPKCGKQLSIRLGRRGRFIGCSGFPDCDYTRNLNDDAGAESTEPQVVEGRQCPKCDSDLIIRMGRYGKFIGCSAYPKCRHIEPLEKPRDTGIECPECHKGTLLEKKSRYGKIFFSCSTYPECKYAVWNEPVPGPCPDCGWPILTVKTTKRRGTERVCPQKECGFAEPAPEMAPETETGSG